MATAGPTVRLTFAGDSTDLEKAMDRVGAASGRMEKGFSAKSAGLAAAGAAAGAGLVAAFSSSLDFQDAQAKLTAQMGAGPAAAQAGAIAGELYGQAYGENLGEVSDAVKAVMQSGAVMAGASNQEIQGVTANVMSLAQAFGQDTVGATNAVSQMMKTGLAPNAQAALDILTVGFQQGNDKAGDLLDTFNEYGTQFRKVGLDGQTAMGLISQGLQAGARDADVVADAIKEFSIRAIDGSKTTADGFAAIGLNAQDMAAKIAAGGPTASAALDLTLDRLRGMKDPTDQAAAAVALFGTQAEDMGAALYALDPSEAVAKLGEFGGAAQGVNDTLGDTASNKIEAVKRGFTDWTNQLVGVQGPLGDVAAGVVGMGGDAITMVGSLGMAGMALSSLGIWTGVATAAQWAWNFAMSMNPIGLVILGIGLLVGAFIWLWNNVEGFRNFFIGAWEWIKNAAGSAATWISDRFNSFIGWLTGLPGRATAALGRMWDGLKDGFRSALNWVIGKWNNFSLTLGGGSVLGMDIPSVRLDTPNIPYFHTGGLVPGAAGSETLAMLQAGERVIPADRSGNGGGGAVTVRFVGDLDSALATLLMRLIRSGQLQLETA